MRRTAIGSAVGLLSMLLGACGSGGSSGSSSGSSATSTAGAAATAGTAGTVGTAGTAGASASGGQASGTSGSSSGGANSGQSGSAATAGSNSEQAGGTQASGGSPMLGGCAVLPANHIFNTPIDKLPVHASSQAFLDTIGAHKIHLDLGTSVDQKSEEYYGIPYNVVHSKASPWVDASYSSTDKDLSWDPSDEADCAAGDTHKLTSPCTAAAAAQPEFPIPAAPLIEGGIVTAAAEPYGDHHLLLLDADTCSLWELYHVYPDPKGGWDIFGSAYFDLHSNALRPAGWTSADAAGFPILPLLLRADEASSGSIRHALRFTIDSDHIRQQYTWPARHLTSNGSMSMSEPPMGQAFRIKSSFMIPANFNTQSRAIVQALKTYGMYIADGGSAFYIQGEPSANWQDDTFGQVQSVSSTEFEAVDLSAISRRAGFDPNSAAVP